MGLSIKKSDLKILLAESEKVSNVPCNLYPAYHCVDGPQCGQFRMQSFPTDFVYIVIDFSCIDQYNWRRFYLKDKYYT